MRCFLLLFLVLLSLGSFGSERVATIKGAARSAQAKPSPVWLHFFKKQNQRKKVIASALAFPLPCGFLGLHRVYLGTKPYIPVVYVGTLGGCAGLLPLIDFCTLVSNSDISRFQANPRIFMWVDNEKKNK
jgi:hypothetical protein